MVAGEVAGEQLKAANERVGSARQPQRPGRPPAGGGGAKRGRDGPGEAQRVLAFATVETRDEAPKRAKRKPIEGSRNTIDAARRLCRTLDVAALSAVAGRGLWIWYERGRVAVPREDRPVDELSLDKPNVARMYDYFLGAMLGVGVLTRITFASFYVLLLWTLLSGAPLRGAVIFGAYGLARAVPAMLLSPFLRHDEVAYQVTWLLMPWQRPLQRLTGVVLVSMAVLVFAQAR